MKHELIFNSIGVIQSPHRSAAGTPIQPAYAEKVEGEVVIDDGFIQALDDLEGFERIWIIYCLNRAKPWNAKVVPYRDVQERGLFSTRAPSRPNPIGMSAVRLLGREHNVLRVQGMDVLDGTPLLDIKPYIPEFDSYPGSKAGWLDKKKEDRQVADERFH